MNKLIPSIINLACIVVHYHFYHQDKKALKAFNEPSLPMQKSFTGIARTATNEIK